MGTEKVIKIEEVFWKRKTKIPSVYDIQVSGGGSFVLNGIIVHNSAVELGREEKEITGTQTVHISSHRRKGYRKKNGTYVPPTRVKAHDVTYEGKKLICWEPRISKFILGDRICRVIEKESAREGQFFLTRAFKEGFPHLAKDIELFIQKLERR